MDELPAYGEETLRSQRKTRPGGTIRPGKGGVANRILKTTSNDGSVFYFRIGGVFRKTTVWLTKSKSIDVFYSTSAYVRSDDDVRRVASLIGLKMFGAAVAKQNYDLTDELIETLFKQDKAVFWVSKNGKRLLGSASEINEERHGPLRRIDAFAALKRYGVDTLDESVERGIAEING